MRYVVSLEIARPREEVVQLLADPAVRPAWLRGLVSHEAVSGEEGQVGTESRVVMRAGNREMELVETITRREPAALQGIPAGGVVRYDRELVGGGMWSAARERFTDPTPATTLWESENEFRFDDRVMRLLAPLMTSSFRKQSLRHMRDVKAFAEDGTDVRDG